jgi:hypothetical protein
MEEDRQREELAAAPVALAPKNCLAALHVNVGIKTTRTKSEPSRRKGER